ncbi:MAG TPA: uracil-DNA glycosylase [Thermoanaerobaculia bacterium]
MTARRFDRLLRDLAEVELGPRAVNQFSATSGDVRANAIRRRNLRLYLEQLAAIGPRMLLIGEAVSHRGGRLTGIAFVSETVMLAGVDTANGRILGADHGYRKATGGPRLSTEASATMVWGTIRTIDPLPLLWNAFPFHPFHEGEPESNRVPSAAELLTGQRFIEQLTSLFHFDQIVAIGNQAALSLTRLAIPHTKVRHPSMGGKNEFIAQMASLSQKKDP